MANEPSFTLTFWGAARTVTGSMHHIGVNGQNYLLDCGMFQGQRQLAYERNKTIPFDASKLTSVVLSHAHIDHSGNLPNLAKSGYQGPVYATPATIDLCRPMLADTARIQEKDSEFVSKGIARRKKLGMDDPRVVVPPIYTEEDAKAFQQQLRPLPLGQVKEIGPGVTASLTNAGHLLGSAYVLLETQNHGAKRRLLFSGDVGRANLPIIPDPDPAPEADYVIMESTYGNRLHLDVESVSTQLISTINRVLARGGHIVAPSFAVGRTQQIVLLLHELIRAGKLPSFPIFVDSPLAVEVTDVFRKNTADYDAETAAFTKRGEDPFDFARLTYIRDVESSKALNDLRVPYMVIASSGMCEAGRVLHHLRHSVEDPRNLILITGYQAENTLGRKIVNKEPEVAIFGEPMRLRAEVAVINELSGHADQRELLNWLRPIAKGVIKVFLVHGEPDAQAALKTAAQQEFGLDVTCPSRGDIVTVD